MPNAALHHVSVIVHDLARASAFYDAVFGLSQLQRPPFTVPGRWYAVGALQLHLIEYPAGSFRQRGVDNDDVHFAFNTTDFDGWLAHLTAIGFREDAPADDPKRMIVKRTGLAGFPQLFFTDPDSNIIEVNGAG